MPNKKVLYRYVLLVTAQALQALECIQSRQLEPKKASFARGNPASLQKILAT